MDASYGNIEDYNEYCNIIKYDDGLVEINGPHETKVVHTSKRNIDYFDIKPLLLVLCDANGDFSLKNNTDIHTFYGSIDNQHYKITINVNSSLIEMINTKLNISSDFEYYDIPPLDYPVYQYTSNPAIVMLAIFVASCNIDNMDDSNYLMYSADNLAEKIAQNEDYFLDIYGILILSLYKQTIWHSIKEMGDIIEQQFKELTDKRTDLEIQKMNSDNTYIYQGQALFSNIDTEIRRTKELTKTYSKLAALIKTLNLNYDIMEFKVGSKSYFIIRQEFKILTIHTNEYNTTKLTPIDDELEWLYGILAQSSTFVIANYNKWSDDIEKGLTGNNLNKITSQYNTTTHTETEEYPPTYFA